MSSPLPAVYWDSCVFIDLFQQTPLRYEACLHITDRAEKGKLQIVTSAVTISEVSRVKNVGVIDEKTSQKILDFFENPYIYVRQLDRETGKDAHVLARLHNLTPLDSIHLATALSVSAVTEFHTYDGITKRRQGILKWDGKIGHPRMKIIKPPDPPPTLFAYLPPPEPPAIKPVPTASGKKTGQGKKSG